MSELDEILNEEQRAAPTFSTATVAATYTGKGVKLIFPGETEAGEKYYKCLAAAAIKSGDRVVVLHDSGTTIVLGTLGTKARTWRYTKLSSSATLASCISYINALIDTLSDLDIVEISS